MNCIIPVVDVPVVGGKVDQPVVQRQLLVVKVGKVLLGEAEKLGFKRIRNEPQNILNHVYRVTQVYSTNLLLTYVWGVRKPVGRYCCYLLTMQDGRISQIYVNRRFYQ